MNKVLKKDLDSLLKSFKYEKELKNKTILVTGATGLIAKNFTWFLLYLNKELKMNMKVVALVRNIEKAKKIFGDLEEYGLEYLVQDICSKIEYDGKVDYIFHAAGSCSAQAIKTIPVDIIKANTLGTINVLELAREKKTKKVLFPSTREIYGQIDNRTSISESDMGFIDPLNSRNCYPESKRLSEALLRSYNEQYGVNFNVMRIAHVYGPGMAIENDGRVMADFIGAAVKGNNIVLNSDGSAIRAFCYVSDAVNGILDVMVKGKKCEAYNLANETEPYMIRDVAQMICDIYPEKNMKVEFTNPGDENKKGYLSYKIVKLDTSKLEKLGWNVQVKLKKGLKQTIDYFNED